MRPHRRARTASIVIAPIVATLIVILALRTTSSTDVTTTALGGVQAPNIAGRTLISDRPISLRSMRGRYVVLDFFASWCETCISDEPAIEQFSFEHRDDRSVAFIGVDIDDSVANATAFLVRYGATWNAISDSTGTIAQSYGVTDPPELFLVDPKGRIVSSISSAVTAPELSSWLEDAKAAHA